LNWGADLSYIYNGGLIPTNSTRDGEKSRYMSNEAERLKEIIRLDTELADVQDEDLLLERILTEARKITSADAGTIYTKEGDYLVFSYVQNATLEKELSPGQKLPQAADRMKIDTKKIAGYVAATGEILNIPDVYRIPSGSPFSFDSSYDERSNYTTTSMLTVPLKSNTIIGVLQIINKIGDGGRVVPFDPEDDVLCRHFASSASFALRRAQLHRTLLLRMIAMAELRDPKETGPHVNRVASYATEIYETWARKRGIPESVVSKTRDDLRRAAMLHDVGKVAITDKILSKPGTLTDEEREIMQGHTYKGAWLFKDKQSAFDEIASQAALRHHENWDGTGYPGYVDVQTGKPSKTDETGGAASLKGEEIPLFGRLVAVADVFDALRSKRAYKEAWPEKDVLAEIKKLSGKKFDPDIVEAFFECIEVIRNIAKKYPDTD
jgi:HD-GYP domain-containing protein (c-di-GMP phosphodiesterase class II)